MSDQKPHLDSLFEAAVSIESAAERADFLEKSCGDDLELRKQVELLLQSDQQAGSFLDKPPAELEGTVIGQSGGNLAASMEAGLAPAFGEESAVVIGDANHSVLKMLGQTMSEVPRVSLRESKAEGPDPITQPSSPEVPKSDSDSRYRLDGEIARGGMGAIIKGRDTDLGRDLAIKVLLDSHKDKPEVIQRFVEEAQIGGQLQHPGIAPVYELGQFADKRPFFAMKLVKGETLAKLLDDREDAADERGKFIGIFEQICQTMAYAHSRGVIHRDLKPANIMVGAFGEVQVMDWGLAKVLPKGGVADEKKARQTQQGQSIIQTMRSAGSDVPGSFGSTGSDTQMGSVMGTPAYMPPEQALGEIDQMNERADVFGLGAILCEILTGKPPYVGDDGTQVYRLASRGKLEDCFERLDSCEGDAELLTLTRHCLEIEPANRPGNAGVLAESVSGYLESVETKLRETELGKADALVRAEELKRRNKLALTAGTVIVATLLIGISVSLWQMSRATKAEALARREADRATTAEGVAKDEAVRATQAETLAKDEAIRATAAEKRTAETLVAVAAERDAKELARKDAADISTFLGEVMQSPDPTRDGREIMVVELLDNAAKKLETDLADQPAQRAKLQDTLGRTYYALGLYQQAIPLWEQVRDYHLTTSGPEHLQTLTAMNNLAVSYHDAGRRDEALKLQEEVLPLRRKLLGPEHPDTLMAMGNLASSYNDIGRQDEALKLREEVLTLRCKVSGPEHPDTLSAMNNLAISYDTAGRRDEALKLREEVLTLRRKRLGPEHPDTLTAMGNLANSYGNIGRLDEALKLREKVLPLRRQLLGPEHPDTLSTMHNLAVSYHDAGRRDEALQLFEEVLTLRRKLLGPEHPDTLDAMTNLANSYGNIGRLDEALKLREEVLTLRRKLLGPEHPDTLTAMGNLANSYDDIGRQDEALQLREEVLTLMRKVLGPEHLQTLTAMNNLAVSYADASRNDEALELKEKVLTLRRKLLGPEHPDTLSTMSNLAFSYHDAGRRDEALKLREEVLPLRRKRLGPEHPDTLDTMHNLAVSYAEAGRRDEALKLREEVLPLRRKRLGPEHPDTLMAMGNLANSYDDIGRQDEALKLREEVLTLRRKRLGPEHPDTLSAMNNLAISYDTAGRQDEAMKLFEEVLTLRRKVLAPEHPDTLSAMNNLALSYSNLGFELEPKGKTDEAIAAWRKALELNPNIKTNAPHHLGVLLEQAGKPDEAFIAYLMAIRNGAMQGQAHEKIQVILVNPKNLNACLQALKTKPDLKMVGFTSFASIGRAEEARALLAEFTVTKPEETQLAMKVAALQAWFGQADEHTGFRQRTLAWAADTEEAVVAERVAKLACLRPMEDARTQAAVLALATRAVELGKDDDKAFLPWAQLALGMAEYRNGQLEQAAETLAIATETASDTNNQRYLGLITGTANFYRAMCLFQQGEKDTARALFAATEETMKPLPTDENNPLANHDDLILWLAYKEAKSLLAEPETPEE